MRMKWSQINVPSANTAGTIALDLIVPTAKNLEKRNRAGTIIRITRVVIYKELLPNTMSHDKSTPNSHIVRKAHVADLHVPQLRTGTDVSPKAPAKLSSLYRRLGF